MEKNNEQKADTIRVPERRDRTIEKLYLRQQNGYKFSRVKEMNLEGKRYTSILYKLTKQNT